MAAAPKKRILAPAKTLFRSVLYGSQTMSTTGPINASSSKYQKWSMSSSFGAASSNDDQSHSTKLARGKYVHELVTHSIHPHMTEKYTSLVNEEYSRIINNPALNVHLVGSFQTIIGHDLDQAVHLWEHYGYEGYHKLRKELNACPTHQAFFKDLKTMVRKRSSMMCLEFAFWETVNPLQKQRQPGGVYELRTYDLKPGRLLEWEMYWKRGLEARRQYCDPIGAWFSQLGDLHTVNHLWWYPDLEYRKVHREQAWAVKGWAQTVEKTVPLVDKMQARILTSMACSPLK